jgi:secondary thiamine-phosphate synthase enzyme
MRQHFDTVHVATRRGLTDVTDAVSERLRASGLRDVIQENADPAARRDLEAFLDRLVPEGDALYTHTAEGDDDMPSHVKAALTRTSEQIPFRGGELLLGTWQGLYVWEHRSGRHRRELALHFVGE